MKTLAKARKAELLVETRMRNYGIERVTFQPIDDQVVVWRLPPIQVSAGGIQIPDEGQSPHVKGVILKMGPRAMDSLKSNGIEEGHIVLFERFSGWEHTDVKVYPRKQATRDTWNVVVILRAKQIIGSDDLAKDLASGKAKYIKGADGRYCLERKLIGGRKEKLLALAASTDSPHEAETALRLAKNG